MALLKTPEVGERFIAPDFYLKATDGKKYTLDDVRGSKGTVVMFICNHCPYVKSVIQRLVTDIKVLEDYGVRAVAIMPNDTASYEADSFENMKIFAKLHQFPFPYLIDESQDIAKAYGAVCTPDIFGFNKDMQLVYRGRVDSAGTNEADISTRHELREAMIEVAETGAAPEQQYPSMGCSIKWKSEK